jgi:hypothetical protein
MATSKKPCVLCQTDCEHEAYLNTAGSFKQPIYYTHCPVCGSYGITHRTEISLRSREEYFYVISGVTRNHYEQYNSPLIITESMIENDSEFQAEFLSKMPKSVLDKASLLLQHIARKSDHPGTYVKITPARDYPICFSKNENELRFYINHLKKTEVVRGDINVEGFGQFSLTAEGWERIEGMRRPNLESKQAFVAMWFDESLDEIFTKGMMSLEEHTGFKMYRVDQEPFNEKICDRIIADIRKSRFLIADVTGLRHAVFFEAGYAMGLGLPVIFTCREGTEIEGCFDTRQYNHIVWKDAEELRSKLKDRILATIGKTA